MHEPLSRNWRIKHGPNPTAELARACAFAVILSVAFVAVAVAVGELMVWAGGHEVVTASLTTGSVKGSPDAAPSSNDLFSGMPLP
jgi:hypothetical protein